MGCAQGTAVTIKTRPGSTALNPSKAVTHEYPRAACWVKGLHLHLLWMRPPPPLGSTLNPELNPALLLLRPLATSPQAFIKAVLQARGDLVYRFHKTDIVIVRANGDIKLTTGGWYTATTMASMNDVLSEVHIQV